MARPLLGWFLATCAAVALVLGWVEYFAPITHSTFGVGLAAHGDEATVVAIQAPIRPSKSALRAGDLVLLSQMTMSERLRLHIALSPVDWTMTVPVERGGNTLVTTVTSRSRPPPAGALVSYTFLAIESTITLAIVGLIAWRRPSIATAALLFFGAGSLTCGRLIGLVSWLPDGAFGGATVLIALLGYVPIFALIPFITRFPTLPDTPGRRLRMRMGDAVFVVVALLSVLQAIYEPLLGQSWTALDNATNFASLVVLGFAVVAYLDASGEDRRRIAWVIAGIVVSVVTATVFNAIDAYVSLVDQVYLIAIIAAFGCALPLALGYAILRHRVLDLGFAVNRTLVYGAIIGVVIVLVSLVDWLTGKLIDEQRLAAAVEALLTIAIGFALTFIHRWVERLVDRVIFRKRHLAEKRIEYRIEALAFSESESAVDEALSRDAPEILEFASAAVFRRVVADAPFARMGSSGWPAGCAETIDSDALLVRSLRAIERPFFLDDAVITLADAPVGPHHPVLAIPVVAQHALVGFVLYGNHRDGSSPDPDETALLFRLARAAGVAYATVEARRWRERVASLERSLGTATPA
jgi:hypothetical protein